MRHSIFFVVLLATACATSGPQARSSAKAAPSASDAAQALVAGDYARALDLADRGLAAHPDDPWLLYNRGAALAGLGHVEGALETLRAAEQRFATPHERSLAAYRRALLLELSGRCAEASTELSTYAALVAVNEPDLARDALAHLAFCVPPTPEEVAERQDADMLKLAAPAAEVRRAEALSSDAVRALTHGDYQAALAAAEAALAVVPDDPWALYNEGTALAGLQRTDEALHALRQAERLFSESNTHGRSVAIYRRAMALEVAGRCEEEATELQRYAQLTHAADPAFAAHAMAHVKWCKLANAGAVTF